MQESGLSWHDSYVIPASLSFRPTSSGSLQTRPGVGEDAVEVPKDLISLLLAFAHGQSVEAAYEAATAEWELDRESFEKVIQKWVAQGLLRISRTDPRVPSRLALFAHATSADPARRVPLHSNFALQRPVEFYPGLDTREVHDGARFPWVALLESSFEVIRDELARLLATGPGFSSVYRAQTSTGEWAANYLWVFGKKVEEVCRSCPETTRILSSIPGVAEFGTTLFSGLAPHTHVSPHHGYTNAKLRCQLPLRVPGHCKLKVGEHEIEQCEGRCIVFDDSFLHTAWNESDEPRFVLVFDFFHPDLTPPEIRYLLQLAAEQQLAKGIFSQAAAGQRVAWAGSEAG